MKAISYSRYGSADVLEYGERPDPKAGPDPVLVKVRAAAVNPVDRKAREGCLRAGLEAVFPVVRLARHAGCRVVGTAGPHNHDYVRRLGGEPVEHGDGLAARLRALVPDGFDAAFDTVGGEALRVSAETLAP